MISTLLWKPHLGTLANGLIILAIMGWLCILWYRYRSRYTPPRTIMLLAPKAIFAILAIVALMDPAWRDVAPSEDSQRVAIVVDISTSMDVADDGKESRSKRAEKIVEYINDELSGIAGVEKYRFDVDILAKTESPANGTRSTDLGRTTVALSDTPDLADCKAVVLVTDGGDEVIRTERLPEVPMYIAGVGTDPSTWNDLEITNTNIPEEVELKTPFKISADIVVHSASGSFAKRT